MFDLKIDGLFGAEMLAKQGWPTAHLSTVCKGAVFSRGPHHLVLEFDDVEAEHVPGGPRRHHIDAILRFGRKLTDDDKLLVHCHAGMRRSTAASIGLMIQHGLSIEDAFAHCFKIRPIMMPNRLMLRHLDEALGLNGDLIEFGQNWVRKVYFEPKTKEARQQALGQDIEDWSGSVDGMKKLMRLMGDE